LLIFRSAAVMRDATGEKQNDRTKKQIKAYLPVDYAG
jgi:hypothetical protein